MALHRASGGFAQLLDRKERRVGVSPCKVDDPRGGLVLSQAGSGAFRHLGEGPTRRVTGLALIASQD